VSAKIFLSQLEFLGLHDEETLLNKNFCCAADVLQFILEKNYCSKTPTAI